MQFQLFGNYSSEALQLNKKLPTFKKRKEWGNFQKRICLSLLEVVGLVGTYTHTQSNRAHRHPDEDGE